MSDFFILFLILLLYNNNKSREKFMPIAKAAIISTKDGDTIILECESNTVNLNDHCYRWQHNGYDILEKSSTLILHQMSVSDTGHYDCYRLQQSLPISSFDVDVTMAIATDSSTSIFLKPNLSYEQVQLGQNVTLSCTISGNISTVKWTRCSNWDDEVEGTDMNVYDDSYPISHMRAIIGMNGRTSYLKLIKVNHEDAGCYRCRLDTRPQNHAQIYLSVIENSLFDNNLLNGISICAFLILTATLIALMLRSSAHKSKKTPKQSRRGRRIAALSVASSQSSNQVTDLFNFDPLNFV